MLEILDQERQVDVNSLAEKFSTSKETIRRDLKRMEASGLLKRTHGGAVPIGNKFSQGYEYPLFAREIQKYDEKQRIQSNVSTKWAECICIARHYPA